MSTLTAPAPASALSAAMRRTLATGPGTADYQALTHLVGLDPRTQHLLGVDAVLEALTAEDCRLTAQLTAGAGLATLRRLAAVRRRSADLAIRRMVPGKER